MTLYAIIFYILAAIVLAATVLAVTSRNVMHAIIYVVVSFFAMAPLFYLLGAPFLALLEIIIYAGAIMVLFLFVVMMLKIAPSTTAADCLAPAVGSGPGAERGDRPHHDRFCSGRTRPSNPGCPWPGLSQRFRLFCLRPLLAARGNCLRAALCGPGGGLLSGPPPGRDRGGP